jgi:hypothetical protein
MVVMTVVVIPIVIEFSPETFLHLMLELLIESETDIIDAFVVISWTFPFLPYASLRLNILKYTHMGRLCGRAGRQTGSFPNASGISIESVSTVNAGI